MSSSAAHERLPTRLRSPYEDASWLSRVFFLWINPLIRLGFSKPLEASDIPPVPSEFSADSVLARFDAAWKKERELKGAKAHVGPAMRAAFRSYVLWSGIFFVPFAGILLVQPFFVSDILSYLTGSSDRYFGIQNGFALACVFGTLSMINAVVTSISFYLVSLSGFQMKVATIASVFAKSLRLSSASRGKNTTGEKVTLISADAERVWFGVLFVHWIWAGPLMMIIAMILLILEVGVAAVVAFVVMLLITALQAYIGNQVGGVRAKQMRFTEERTKIINESLQGIRILKFYAWESATAHRIQHLRDQEVAQLTRFQMLKMFNTFLMFVGPLIIAFTLFIVYIRMGGHLTVAKVYTLYALLNVIKLPFGITPMAYAAYQETVVALNRITEFLLLEEEDSNNRITDGSSTAESAEGLEMTNQASSIAQDKAPEGSEGKLLFSMRNASFGWDNSSDSFALKDITLDIHSSDFVAIVGSVGCGKTSLISAMLGQMVTRSGTLDTHGTRVAYVAQEHWICNTSLINNITFNSTLHEPSYVETIDNSQLTNDLLVLPNADFTHIGERGLNLSGGQKARVSIARALYSGYHLPLEVGDFIDAIDPEQTEALAAVKDVDCYIFDDALASVDVHVGKALFNHAVCSPYVASKARIICLSSNYHYLPYFDKIIVLQDGKIAQVGTYNEISQTFPEYDVIGKNADYYKQNSLKLPDTVNAAELLAEEDNEEAEPVVEQPAVVAVPAALVSKHSKGKSVHFSSETEPYDPHNVPRPVSLFEGNRQLIEKKRGESNELMTTEDREKGAVAAAIYLAYFSFAFSFAKHYLQPSSSKRAVNKLDQIEQVAINRHYSTQGNQIVVSPTDPHADKPETEVKTDFAGIGVATLIFVLFAFSQGTRVLADLWMGYWAEEEQGISSHHYSSEFYRVYFIVLTWGTVFACFMRSLIFVGVCLGSSYNLHHQLLINVFNAPINNYFDVTPMGRILNRFTKDFDNLDALLPDFFHQTLQNVFNVVAIVIVCLTSSPYFILLFSPLAVGFYFIQNYFRKSCREMKRLDNISRSPIYSLYTEILAGLTTIKTFQYTPIFKHRFFHLINAHVANFFVFWFSSRWLAIRLDLISNLVTFFVAILAVALEATGKTTNGNLIGIALVYSLQLTATLQWTVRISIETETNMTSVERLLVFKDIVPEEVICRSFDDHGDHINVDAKDIAMEEGSASGSKRHLEDPNALRSAPLDELVNWPQKGQITLKNVFLRYRPDLPFVLNGLNLTIPGGCKVGICGRTAAGKSSLMLALFRIVEVDLSSVIEIDGINIQCVPLHILRSQMTIIPQDPFMFSGTLRENLDPFDQYSDTEVFEALERVHLLEDVQNKFPAKLQHPITERGENISVGQRQLICIARALLRKSKVIIMDEATASVDSVTDAKIQRTIREEFKNCTVLTIAHRLETIADYDMVVVMAYGKVAEVGAPWDLLSDDAEEGKEDRLFQGFIDELGPERKAAFMDIVRSRSDQTAKDKEQA